MLTIPNEWKCIKMAVTISKSQWLSGLIVLLYGHGVGGEGCNQMIIKEVLGVAAMQTALDNKGCAIVRDFLSTLCIMHDKLGRPKEINIGAFLSQYRDNINGYCKRNSGRKVNVWTKDKIELAAKLHKEGKSWSEVGKQFGCSRTAVCVAVSDYKTGRKQGMGVIR